MEKEWFIQSQDHHKGPFTIDEVLNLWEKKELDGDSFFWKKGMSHWQRMDRIDKFRDYFPPQELPQNHIEKLYEVDESLPSQLPPIPGDQGTCTVKKQKIIQLNSLGKTIYGALVILIFIGLGFYYFQSIDPKAPEGLPESQFQILKQVTGINPENHIRFESYFDSEKNRLWLASNIEDNVALLITVRSIPGKVLSLGEINFETRTELKNYFAFAEVFEFSQGTQIYPGLYRVNINYKYAGLKKNYSDVLYLGPGSEDEFSKNLFTYQKYVKEIFGVYQSELLEKYGTLIALTKDLEGVFVQNMKNLTRGKKIKSFEKYYVKNIGPFLTQFTIDSFERPLEIKMDVSAIKSYFQRIFDLSKRLSQLNARIIEEIHPLKKVSATQRQDLRAKYQSEFRKLKESLFYEQARIKGLQPI